MSSKIEVPMQLFQYALNAVEYLALRADDIGSSNVPVADAMRALLAAPVVERQPNKCGQCSASTTDICNQNGCGFLESGNGAPVVERQPNPEPEAFMYQHEETGVIGFVDLQQVEWGFEKNNPRLHIICPLFRAPPELAELQALSVTNIMLDVVPGDGDGHEVYAKSVADVEDALTKLYDESEELQATIARLTALCVEKDDRMGEMNKGWAAAIDQRDTLKAEIERLKGGQGEAVVWSYCPECGCEDLHHEQGEHKQCASCYQEWFSDIDYSEVVRGNLVKLKDSPPAPVAVVLPERKPITPGFVDATNRGWNSCLDKVKEMNQ